MATISSKIHNLPSSVAQYSLQRAHLSAIIFPFESTFVAHHHFPLPSLLHPLYFLPLYIKGNTQSSTTPSSLPNLTPLPWALQVMCFPKYKLNHCQKILFAFAICFQHVFCNYVEYGSKFWRPQECKIFSYLDLPSRTCYSEPISANCLVYQLLLHILVLFLLKEMVHNHYVPSHFV